MKQVFAKALAALMCASNTAAHNILDYGAIVDKTSHHAEVTNSMAIQEAILAANSDDNDDRVVEIPAGMTFSSLPIRSDNLKDVTIQIDGTLLASKDYKSYPIRTHESKSQGDKIEDFFAFYDSDGLTF